MPSSLWPLVAALAGGCLGFAGVCQGQTILTQPQSQTVLAGGVAGFSVIVTNTASYTFNLDSRGSHTNVVYTGRTAGRLTNSYDFYGVGDRMTVYYDNARIYDTGQVSGSGNYNVSYGPGSNTSVTVIMNEGNDYRASTWEYHLSLLLPLYYQWQRNGTNIAGATNATYTFSNVQPPHAGNYRVVVTDATGSSTSNPALLKVLISPSLTSVNGSSTNFSFTYATVVGSTYVVEYKSNLNDATWTPAATNIGTGNLTNYFATVTGIPRRFYRVLVR